MNYIHFGTIEIESLGSIMESDSKMNQQMQFPPGPIDKSLSSFYREEDSFSNKFCARNLFLTVVLLSILFFIFFLFCFKVNCFLMFRVLLDAHRIHQIACIFFPSFYYVSDNQFDTY